MVSEMSRMYWTNLANTFNINSVDPLDGRNLLPMSMHDEDYGVEYHFRPETDSFGWDVVDWKTSNL